MIVRRALKHWQRTLAMLFAAALAAGAAGVGAEEPAPGDGAAATEVRIERNTGPLEIAIAYPLLPDSEPAGAAANATVKARVEALLAEFESEYQSFAAVEPPPDAATEGDTPPWTLDISYGEVYTGPGFWSLPLTVYQYTGGAHGGTTTLPLVIDRRTGAEIPPGGLFREGANWLPVLADACFADLSAHREVFDADDEWLREGTAPTPENYQALLPRADGLQVSFQQYQVGPYAVGAFEVLVPYATLQPLLAPALFEAPAP